MLLAEQSNHQRLVNLGPLVLEIGFLNSFDHFQQIGTKLSHDVLNPPHVLLSSANSRTLGTFFSARM